MILGGTTGTGRDTRDLRRLFVSRLLQLVHHQADPAAMMACPGRSAAVQTSRPLTDDESADLVGALRDRLEARADPAGPAPVVEPAPLRRLDPETEALLDGAASARLALLFEPR